METVITAVIAAVGASILSPLFTFILNWLKSKSEIDLAKQEKLIHYYNLLVEKSIGEVELLKAKLDKSLEQNIKLVIQLTELKSALLYLKTLLENSNDQESIAHQQYVYKEAKELLCSPKINLLLTNGDKLSSNSNQSSDDKK
jgi:hypothetical protein